jgi:hypothetical protein
MWKELNRRKDDEYGTLFNYDCTGTGCCVRCPSYVYMGSCGEGTNLIAGLQKAHWE